MEQVKASFVCGKKRAIDGHATEGSDAHTTVRVAAPRATPVLQLDKFARSLLDKSLDSILVRQEVSTKNSVLRMEIEAIKIAHNCRGSAFCGNRVTSHRIDLGDYCDR